MKYSLPCTQERALNRITDNMSKKTAKHNRLDVTVIACGELQHAIDRFREEIRQRREMRQTGRSQTLAAA